MDGVAEPSLVRAAAQNNSEWCDAFCRTHGVVGRFREHCWFSPVRTPPYYPDAVTLLPDVGVEDTLSGIDTTEGCSVKDSFADLELDSAGFRPLFRAEWLVSAQIRLSAAKGWSALATEEQLGEWEAAWAGLPEGKRFFRRALLEDETIRVLARYEGARIVAGAIANRSAAVTGLSNVFDVAGDTDSAWAAGAAVAAGLWGDMPTVGYESGDCLDAAHKAGFESIGDLVVWIKAPSAPN